MGSAFLLFWIVVLLDAYCCSCRFLPRPLALTIASTSQVKPQSLDSARNLVNDTRTPLRDRAITTELSTCGYLNGNPEHIRTAESGYNCRIDTRNGLWGFCPTSVLAASDCGLAGSCVDSYGCSRGCGATDREELTTFTCRDNFCSTALLTFGVDQTYAYIACGAKSGTDHYHITPTAQEVTTSASQPATATSTSSAESGDETSSRESTSRPPQNSSPRSLSSAGSTDASSGTPVTTQPSQGASSMGTPSAERTLSTDTETEVPGSSREDTSQDASQSSIPLGAIIGGAIGGLALLCATTVAVIYLLRRNKGSPPPPSTKPEGEQRAAPIEANPSHPCQLEPYKPLKPQELDIRSPQELNAGYYHYNPRHVAELAS